MPHIIPLARPRVWYGYKVVPIQFDPLPSFAGMLSPFISAILGLWPPPRKAILPGKLVYIQDGYRKPSPEELVDLVIERHAARVSKHSLSGGDESFFVADLGQVERQHRRWTQSLPKVRPYYGTFN